MFNNGQRELASFDSKITAMKVIQKLNTIVVGLETGEVAFVSTSNNNQNPSVPKFKAPYLNAPVSSISAKVTGSFLSYSAIILVTYSDGMIARLKLEIMDGAPYVEPNFFVGDVNQGCAPMQPSPINPSKPSFWSQFSTNQSKKLWYSDNAPLGQQPALAPNIVAPPINNGQFQCKSRIFSEKDFVLLASDDKNSTVYVVNSPDNADTQGYVEPVNPRIMKFDYNMNKILGLVEVVDESGDKTQDFAVIIKDCIHLYKRGCNQPNSIACPGFQSRSCIQGKIIRKEWDSKCWYKMYFVFQANNGKAYLVKLTVDQNGQPNNIKVIQDLECDQNATIIDTIFIFGRIFVLYRKGSDPNVYFQVIEKSKKERFISAERVLCSIIGNGEYFFDAIIEKKGIIRPIVACGNKIIEEKSCLPLGIPTLAQSENGGFVLPQNNANPEENVDVTGGPEGNDQQTSDDPENPQGKGGCSIM